MSLAIARVSIPAEARRGSVIEIKALIRHPMETGYRLDSMGRRIPRHIVRSFRARYAGEEFFSMDLTQGIAANPFFAFSVVASESAELAFEWEDEHGETTTVVKALTVIE